MNTSHLLCDDLAKNKSAEMLMRRVFVRGRNPFQTLISEQIVSKRHQYLPVNW